MAATGLEVQIPLDEFTLRITLNVSKYSYNTSVLQI